MGTEGGPVLRAESGEGGLIHFDQRCKERGISSRPAWMIRKAVEKAVREGLDDLVKRVKSYDEQADIWRFRVEEGIFYAVVSRTNGRCMTMLTQQMFSENRKRWKRKRTGT
jgi:hypothetical protein